jgi:hypothetical protein
MTHELDKDEGDLVSLSQIIALYPLRKPNFVITRTTKLCYLCNHSI